MRVISYGISLGAGNKHISLSQLFASMKADNGKEDRSKLISRLFYIDDSDQDFYRGLVVTVRDQAAFCKLVQAGGGNLTIQVQNLDEAERIMEFNLFVLRKENGLGIYQYYHRSCSPNTFLRYLKAKYRGLSNDHMEGALAHLEQSDKATDRQRRNIRAQYRTPLQAGLLVRPDSLETVLQQYEEVKGFSFEITSLSVRRGAAGPLNPFVTKVRQTVSFSPDASRKKLSTAIKDYLSSINPKTARLSVVDDDDESFSLRIMNIPQNFGESIYDDIAAELEGLDVSKFAKHPLLAKLRETCLEHPEVFLAKIKG